MDASPAARGPFVGVTNGRDGIGRLAGRSGEVAEIEYFVSPAGPTFVRKRALFARLRRVHLSPQTRVYVQDGFQWLGGRITEGPISPEGLPPELAATEDHYEVQFPNNRRVLLANSQIHVRWARPIEDPSDHLAARITETPFFFDARSRVVRYLAHQRAAFGACTALASSAIEFIEHQVSAVRRILADPVQRYLLADEVGLGKTIEAGILMRQHAIDTPHEARVLAVVPRHLRSQWQAEMRTKFFLGEEYVTVLGDDELAEAVNDEIGLQYTMLIVDEAHQVALRAFASTEASRRIFDQVRRLTRTIPRVLLLSGTPVLHQEDGFLAMLHLLDPDAYRLEDREAFRRRVSNRQVIADATADLSDDADSLFAEEALAKLESAFSDDSHLARLAQEVRSRLPSGPDEPLRRASLRALRIHLIETYRLHRRMVRTRREDSRLGMYLPRRLGWAAINHEDQARREAFEFLDAWRFEVSGTLQGSGSQAAYGELFAHWVDRALSHPRLLAEALRERLSTLGTAPSKKRKAPAQRDKRHGSAPAFPTEADFVRARLDLLEAAACRDDRTAALAKWLQSNADIRKAVVFVDDAAIADEVAVGLGSALGAKAVERLGPSEDGYLQGTSEARVLVCDAASEEGLNLQQYGAVVVHYDLPLAPTRIEQRIGRIDRLQARKDTRNFVCLSGGPYEAEWAECLGSGTRIFERSIAPLQYLVAELTGRLREDLLENGREAFSTAMKKMNDAQSGLDAELRRVRAQEALDAFEGEPESDREFYEALEGADELAEDEGPEAFDGWVVSRLQFKKRICDPGVFRYVYNKDGSPTLIPIHDVIERFRHCLDPDPRARQWKSEAPLRKCTFSRAASESKSVGLLRVGHQFVDGMASYIREDDRGLVFAIWRHVPGLGVEAPRLYFRYDFVVEADITQASLLLDTSRMSSEALRRRADEAFPVQYHTVWLDSDLARVEDPQLLAQLDQPYSKIPRKDGSRDVNLKPEHWATIDALGQWQDWADLCVRSSQVARAINNEREEMRSLCRVRAAHLRSKTATNLVALQARLSRLEGRALEAETAALLFEDTVGEALAAGIEEPRVFCDSCGAVFLASVALT